MGPPSGPAQLKALLNLPPGRRVEVVMLRHVQCTFPDLSWLLVLVAACSLAACGGSIGGESVTGSSVAVSPSDPGLDLDLEFAFEQVEEGDLFENEDGTLSTAGRSDDKVLVCHKGRQNLWVSEKALRGHLWHGDTSGSCDGPPSARCPCFTGSDITSAVSTCSSNVEASCSTGDPYYLLLSCAPGGDVPQSVLGFYLSQESDGGFCSRDDVNGRFSRNGLTNAEYQACVNVINRSGYCS